MTRVIVRPAAAAEIEDAAKWYERQRSGLGGEFIAAARSALKSIEAAPERYAVVYRGTRRVLLERFPYGLYYHVRGETAIIVACMHGRRSPRRWRSRVED